MAVTEIQRFADAVRQDKALQAELMHPSTVEDLITRAVQLARRYNFFFTAREVRAALNEHLNAHHPLPTMDWHVVRRRL